MSEKTLWWGYKTPNGKAYVYPATERTYFQIQDMKLFFPDHVIMEPTEAKDESEAIWELMTPPAQKLQTLSERITKESEDRHAKIKNQEQMKDRAFYDVQQGKISLTDYLKILYPKRFPDEGATPATPEDFPPITISKGDNGYFIVKVDNKDAELGWDEMLGLLASLTMPEERPCLRWLETEQERNAKRESWGKKSDLPESDFSNPIAGKSHIHTIKEGESITVRAINNSLIHVAVKSADWLPYPENKPEDPGSYLVTTTPSIFGEVNEVTWNGTTWGFVSDPPIKVLAFMPLPKPYKKPAP